MNYYIPAYRGTGSRTTTTANTTANANISSRFSLDSFQALFLFLRWVSKLPCSIIAWWLSASAESLSSAAWPCVFLRFLSSLQLLFCLRKLELGYIHFPFQVNDTLAFASSISKFSRCHCVEFFLSSRTINWGEGNASPAPYNNYVLASMLV